MLNILDDAHVERVRLEETQRAMINIFDDVDTEIGARKEAEKRIRALNDDLEARVSQRTIALAATISELEGFAYSVAHDLRVPLRAVDGYSYMLGKRFHDRLGEEGNRLIRVVRDSAQKMGRLIDDTVEDSGIGIAEEHLPKLFEPFTQVDSSLARRHGGTGLGLSIVRRLAELHGGTVGVASRTDSGSRFCVWLPWRAAAPGAPGQGGN